MIRSSPLTFLRKIAFLFGAFAVALPSSFAQTSTDCAALVATAFDVTGWKQQIRDMPQFAAQSAENARTWGADPAVIAHMHQIMEPDIVLKDLEHALARNCDSGMLQVVIAKMGTPLATRMRQIKVSEQNPKTRQQRIAFFQGFRLHPPTDRRHDLAIQIDDATETSQSAWDMLVAMVKATRAKVSADFAAQKQNYEPYLRSAALNDFLFIYRNVGDAELSEYVDLLKTPACQNFNHTLNYALVEELLSRTAQVMNESSRGNAASKSASRP